MCKKVWVRIRAAYIPYKGSQRSLIAQTKKPKKFHIMILIRRKKNKKVGKGREERGVGNTSILNAINTQRYTLLITYIEFSGSLIVAVFINSCRSAPRTRSLEFRVGGKRDESKGFFFFSLSLYFSPFVFFLAMKSCHDVGADIWVIYIYKYCSEQNRVDWESEKTRTLYVTLSRVQCQ